MNKSFYRTKYKSIRNNISNADALVKSEIITNYLILHRFVLDAQNIFVYNSYGREVDTNKIIKKLIKMGKNVLIPKCDINTETMVATVYKTDSALSKNEYGILETEFAQPWNDKIDVAIVPSIAFDMYGNRLGHGKGYYDKFFEINNCIKIGLCYSECLSQEVLPHNENDVPMDVIISDSGVKNLFCERNT